MANTIFHIGRSWVGHETEDECPCTPQQKCGLVSEADVHPNCPEHAAAKTIRQGHPAEQCDAELRTGAEAITAELRAQAAFMEEVAKAAEREGTSWEPDAYRVSQWDNRALAHRADAARLRARAAEWEAEGA
jgi:hypothetical protein